MPNAFPLWGVADWPYGLLVNLQHKSKILLRYLHLFISIYLTKCLFPRRSGETFRNRLFPDSFQIMVRVSRVRVSRVSVWG